MKYGIPTLMEFPDVEKLAEFCAEQGFGFVEMNMTFPWLQADSVDAKKLRELKKRYGIDLTIHLHDQVNPFEFSPEMRRGSLENVRFAMELACELDIPRMTMHLLPGTYSSINGEKTYLYSRCRERYLELVTEFRDMVDARLRGSRTVLCIENTSGYHAFHRDAIKCMLESGAFGLTFDTGHNYKSGGKDEEFILGHAERLKHFHIHDCTISSNHLALGAGGLDVMRYLRMAEEMGCMVVTEVKESGALIRSRAFLEQHDMW